MEAEREREAGGVPLGVVVDWHSAAAIAFCSDMTEERGCMGEAVRQWANANVRLSSAYKFAHPPHFFTAHPASLLSMLSLLSLLSNF